MSKTKFVAFLYVIGIAFTFLGLTEIYFRVEFALLGHDAVFREAMRAKLGKIKADRSSSI